MRKIPAPAFLLAPVGCLLLAGCPLPGHVKAPPTGTANAIESVTTHVITISAGTPLTITPDSLVVHPGDIVSWSSPSRWEVDFGIEGPIDRRVVSGEGGETASAVIRLGAKARVYKYSVTVRVGNQLITEDPKLIVEKEESEVPG